MMILMENYARCSSLIFHSYTTIIFVYKYFVKATNISHKRFKSKFLKKHYFLKIVFM